MSSFTPNLIHPMIVHLPIVLAIALVVTDHVALFAGTNFGGRSCLANLSVLLAVLLGVFTFITLVSGGISFASAQQTGVSSEIMGVHRDMGKIFTTLAVFWAFLRGGLWWWRVEPNHLWRILFVAFELGLIVMVALTAHYGMDLVYGHGIAVKLQAI
ncbi:MAG: hypothetical protein P8Y47_04525 [Alphaproteobacteria bacterium]